MKFEIMRHKKPIAIALIILAVWMIVPGLNKLSPLAWVCPTCVLDSVPLGSDTDFKAVVQTNTAISNLKVNYYIYGPNADSVFYTKAKASGQVTAPSTLAAGQAVTLDIPMFFDKNTWNPGPGYQLIIEVLDGMSPVALTNTMYDTRYYNDPTCRAKVDSLAVSVGGVLMTCAVDVATSTECSSLGGTWSNNMCCKSVESTYASYCGGVAWSFNLVDYGGSVTVYLGSVSPHFG